MTWMVEVVGVGECVDTAATAYVGKVYPCFGSPSWTQQLNALDYVQGQIPVLLPTGLRARVIDRKTGYADEVLVDGWLSQCTGIKQGGQISFQVIEYAYELQKRKCGTFANGFSITIGTPGFLGIFGGTPDTIDEALTAVLATSTSPSGTTTPIQLGTSGGMYVPINQYKNMSLYDIISKLITKQLCDVNGASITGTWYFWFENNYAGQLALYYGTSYTPTGTAPTFTTGGNNIRQDVQDNLLRSYEAVMVIGKTEDISAISPTGYTGNKVAIFNETELTTAIACQAVADSMYRNTYSAPAHQPQVTTKPALARNSDGSRVHVGQHIAVDGVTYVLQSAIWKPSAVQLNFNCPLPTDTPSDQNVASGTYNAFSQQSFGGTAQNVGSNGGKGASWTLTLASANAATSFTGTVVIEKYVSTCTPATATYLYNNPSVASFDGSVVQGNGVWLDNDQHQYFPTADGLKGSNVGSFEYGYQFGIATINGSFTIGEDLTLSDASNNPPYLLIQLEVYQGSSGWVATGSQFKVWVPTWWQYNPSSGVSNQLYSPPNSSPFTASVMFNGVGSSGGIQAAAPRIRWKITAYRANVLLITGTTQIYLQQASLHLHSIYASVTDYKNSQDVGLLNTQIPDPPSSVIVTLSNSAGTGSVVVANRGGFVPGEGGLPALVAGENVFTVTTATGDNQCSVTLSGSYLSSG